MKMVFFGSSEFSVYVLDELKIHGIIPSFIITTLDKPKGRKLIMTPNPVKIWATEHNIKFLEPKSLKNNEELISNLKSLNSDIFLVASYGKIIPREIFEIPTRKTLNIHPSLLPKYRGASPIQSQILNNEKEIGVSIMVITEGMDEGPVVVQKVIPHYKNFDRSSQYESHTTQSFHNASETLNTQNFGEAKEIPGRIELEKILAVEGARLFAHILNEWLNNAIDPIMQNEEKATYCKKIEKEDGLINIEDDAYTNLLKIKAFEGWPTAYYFQNNKRIIITLAEIKDGKLIILKVKPEGKKEMPFADFLRGQK